MTDPNPMEQFKLAIEHHQAGRLEEAQRICKRILKLQPDNADAMHMLGVIAFQVGGSKVAVQLIGKAIRTGPVKESYFINLGEALRADGKRQEAIDCYRRLLAVNPDYAVAHFTLGNVLGEVGEHDEAIASPHFSNLPLWFVELG
ncbi:MAG TPA: tetratricopeptide repeat protein, partial [Rhodospirillaceae bacterium]|nr:tetratricopeptide repeat protein [Rhodospirillaceae bacterium]